jgi:serine/threonine protein kinase
VDGNEAQETISLKNRHRANLKNFESFFKIGQGSQGQVFKARNLVDKRMYAIKKIKISGNSSNR